MEQISYQDRFKKEDRNQRKPKKTKENQERMNGKRVNLEERNDRCQTVRGVRSQ
jgi:hypothetical protein